MRIKNLLNEHRLNSAILLKLKFLGLGFLVTSGLSTQAASIWINPNKIPTVNSRLPVSDLGLDGSLKEAELTLNLGGWRFRQGNLSASSFHIQFRAQSWSIETTGLASFRVHCSGLAADWNLSGSSLSLPKEITNDSDALKASIEASLRDLLTRVLTPSSLERSLRLTSARCDGLGHDLLERLLRTSLGELSRDASRMDNIVNAAMNTLWPQLESYQSYLRHFVSAEAPLRLSLQGRAIVFDQAEVSAQELASSESWFEKSQVLMRASLAASEMDKLVGSLWDSAGFSGSLELPETMRRSDVQGFVRELKSQPVEELRVRLNLNRCSEDSGLGMKLTPWTSALMWKWGVIVTLSPRLEFWHPTEEVLLAVRQVSKLNFKLEIDENRTMKLAGVKVSDLEESTCAGVAPLPLELALGLEWLLASPRSQTQIQSKVSALRVPDGISISGRGALSPEFPRTYGSQRVIWEPKP